MLPRILFLNMNGSGMGHLTRCLAYARRLRGEADSFFFSLASAIEIIEGMGFQGDYFVSHFWSRSSTFAWNSELAIRFGMMLERVNPSVVVFDGTWPFQGFIAACDVHGSLAKVWSNRGLLKTTTISVPVDENMFNLVIQPGELGVSVNEVKLQGSSKKITVPPVCLLDSNELIDRAAARKALNLTQDGRYVLFSLGPGNLKDITSINHGLINVFKEQGFEIVWARAPISVRDIDLPFGVKPLSLYPLARYLRAFDIFVGAAGYNTCCEVVQAGIPTLLVPNEQLADDQMRRAQIVTEITPAIVCRCETNQEQISAIKKLLKLSAKNNSNKTTIPMNGATLAAEQILNLAKSL